MPKPRRLTSAEVWSLMIVDLYGHRSDPTSLEERWEIITVHGWFIRPYLLFSSHMPLFC